MAIAFKCDICGNFYIRNRERYNWMKLQKITNNGWIESEKGYDICPDCESAILNLIKERNKKGTKNETTEKADQESEGIAGEE